MEEDGGEIITWVFENNFLLLFVWDSKVYAICLSVLTNACLLNISLIFFYNINFKFKNTW